MSRIERTILHIDMDAFYASIEIRDDPRLAGLPVVVGGGGARGVVAAASYAARAFGVHSAMATREALSRCKDLIIIAPRIDYYQAVSQKIFAVFNRYTPDIEGLSLDEAFLDLSHCRLIWPDPILAAQRLKQEILSETGLTASIGISVNKLLAKLASDWKKPDGLFEIKRHEAEGLLAPLSIERLYGIGAKTTARLRAVGIYTFADLAIASVQRVRPILGSAAEAMMARARGLDDRPVEPWREGKQTGSERTFSSDLTERREIRAEILKMVDQVSHRLRAEGLYARRLSIKVRRADFKTYTRSRTFDKATQSRQRLADHALALWELFNEEQPKAAIRLLGVAVAELTTDPQSDLFDLVSEPLAATLQPPQSNTNPSELTQALDEIQKRFGAEALKRGSGLKPSR